MTKEEIIEMAKVAKLPYDYETGIPSWLDKLEIFTKLIANHEREACAVVAEESFCGCGRGSCPEADLRANDIASSIRARGQE